MSLHDAYARVTPHELLFSDPARANQLVEAVAEEAAGGGADPTSMTSFLTMGAVSDFMQEVAGTDEGLAHRYGPAVFHGYHFTAAGGQLLLLETAALRYLIGGAPGEAHPPPSPAGYVQLPRHLVWVQGESGVPASVDGIFWSAVGHETLHSLVATGVRGDGSGFDVLPLPGAPLAETSSWLSADGRGDGSDYTSQIPGSELDGLYELRTAGEVLKLLARLFSYCAMVPGALETRTPAGEDVEPRASGLEYTHVSLTA